MKRNLVFILLLIMMVGVIGCSGSSSVAEPTEGLIFAIEADGTPKYDEYEIQLVYKLNEESDDYGFFVVTLSKEENYQVRWSQGIVDENQGMSCQMTAYKSNGDFGPDKDKPLSETRTLIFEEGATNEGRIIKVSVSE